MFTSTQLLLDFKSVVKLTGISRSTIIRQIEKDLFPNAVRSGKKLYWRTADIENWVNNLPQA